MSVLLDESLSETRTKGTAGKCVHEIRDTSSFPRINCNFKPLRCCSFPFIHAQTPDKSSFSSKGSDCSFERLQEFQRVKPCVFYWCQVPTEEQTGKDNVRFLMGQVFVPVRSNAVEVQYHQSGLHLLTQPLFS